MREKLLSYLYSAFDKDPQRVLVMRVSHNFGANWSIADRKLTLTTSSGYSTTTFDLRKYTMYELAQQIRYAGYTLKYFNSSYNDIPADVLLNGDGKEASENGDHIYTFSSTLWGILNVIGLMLMQTKENAVDEAIKMAYLHSSQDFWMEQWASYFGSVRKDGESDADFLARTVAEVVRIRNTPNALKNAVKDLTGIDVFIHELWQDYYSKTDPSNADGTWCKFEAIVYSDITDEQAEEIKSVIERNRPIGVLFGGIVRALQFMLQEDIDYEIYLDQHERYADWHVDHSWNNQWNERLYSGLTISVAMS